MKKQSIKIILLGLGLFIGACSAKHGQSSFPMGSGDLDSNRKSGSYYLQLNAKNNSHLPKAKPYTVLGKSYTPYAASDGFSEIGIASWYGPGFHGKLTANGEKYNQNGITAAHKLLPHGTMIRVTNLENGKYVVVRINDRGPFHDDRIIDLSKGAANRIDMLRTGTAKVHLKVEGEASTVDNLAINPNNSISSNNANYTDFNFSSPSATIGTIGSMFSSGGLLNNPNNPGGFGLPSGPYNRYGEPIGDLTNSAYGLNQKSAPNMSNQFNNNLAQNNLTQGNSGFFTSNPNEFGDDPTYYSLLNKSVDSTLNTDLNYGGIDPYNKESQSNFSAYNNGGEMGTNVSNTISGSYYLQLALFDNALHADQLATDLRKSNTPVVIYIDKGIYLVQAGPFNTDEGAVEAKNKFAAKFPNSYFVIR